MNSSSLQTIHEEMDQAVSKAKLGDQAIQRRILIKLKNEIIHQVDELKMSEDRKSYLIHQLSNAQDMDSLASLLKEMNLRNPQARLSLSCSSFGVVFTQH